MNTNQFLKNKIINFILPLLLLSFLGTRTYAMTVSQLGLDASLVYTYLAEDEGGNYEISQVVNNFMKTYINDNMTDLEKEITIIKYLVETVEYDFEEYAKQSRTLNDSYKAYGALIYKKAVCSGYAKAFDLLAKKCGLMTTIVTGDAMNDYIVGPHAWNQIYLDGDWYNVDVTFEDPQTNIKLGFNDLMNRYINVTDFEMSHNHTRENGHTCTATKYGKNVVGYYLHTGEVNLNGNLDAVRLMYFNMFKQYLELGDEASAQAIVDKIIVVNPKLSDNSNFILYPTDEIINNYILNKFNAGERFICIVTNKGTKDLFSIDKNDWTRNNITLAGRITLYKYFISDGEYEARLLYFKTS